MNIAIVFDGFYCILIGYLVFTSAFLPRMLGALMALGGLGWLTFLSSPLANYLSPYNLAFGLLGEGIGVSVDSFDRRERSTMEGAGQRSGKGVVYGCRGCDIIESRCDFGSALEQRPKPVVISKTRNRPFHGRQEETEWRPTPLTSHNAKPPD